MPLAWSGALAAGPALAAVHSKTEGRRYAIWIGILLVGLVIGQSVQMIREPEYAWQADMRAGAAWLRSHTTDETIGAFNAGIYSYYSERRVLSLDGLVDWGAIEARREERLLDYFAERGGELLIDHSEYLWGSFSSFFGSGELELIAQLPVNDPTYGPIVVYKMAGR